MRSNIVNNNIDDTKKNLQYFSLSHFFFLLANLKSRENLIIMLLLFTIFFFLIKINDHDCTCYFMASSIKDPETLFLILHTLYIHRFK